jgi:glutamyl-tRNA synthetase
MREKILKYALLNAIEHGGKADLQAVLGKLIAEDESIKGKIREIIPQVKEVIEEVNSFSLEEQKRKISEFGMKFEKKKGKEKYELPELPNAEFGKVVTAFPPEPSKFPHLGHAKAALINFLYAKKYKGKFILRFEDSNPELAKKEFYDAFIDGLEWLGIKPDKIDYLSDHLPKFYNTIVQLIKSGHVYICRCNQKTIKTKRALGEACIHREHSVSENLKLWEKMLKVFKPKQATARLKIDMKSPNTTLRDPSIARISDASHPRTGKRYRVWPVYDFGTAMLDIWEKVTHRVRSKEFEIRKELQQYIQKILGKEPPYIFEIGRFKIKGAITQGRVIREMIKKKELFGWDDPRLTTLVALRKRGFLPEALKEFLLSTGVTKTEGVYDWEMVEAINRKFVDPIANRYFAILNPVRIRIEKWLETKFVKVPLHPSFPKRGVRRIPVNPEKIYIEKEDYKNFKQKDVGLINLMTIHIDKHVKFVTEEIRYEDPKIQWVSEPHVRVKIIMPNGKIVSAIAEPDLVKVEAGDLIQLVRVGFCRVDNVGKEIVLYMTHK